MNIASFDGSKTLEKTCPQNMEEKPIMPPARNAISSAAISNKYLWHGLIPAIA